MDKTNIAFGLLTTILAVYIGVALLLSRSRRAETHKTRRRGRRTLSNLTQTPN